MLLRSVASSIQFTANNGFKIQKYLVGVRLSLLAPLCWTGALGRAPSLHLQSLDDNLAETIFGNGITCISRKCLNPSPLPIGFGPNSAQKSRGPIYVGALDFKFPLQLFGIITLESHLDAHLRVIIHL